MAPFRFCHSMHSAPSSSPAARVAAPWDGPGPAPAAAVLGIGAHVPEGVLSNADLEAMVATSDSWILERTGIRERRRAGSGETASVMATAAARTVAIDNAEGAGGVVGLDGVGAAGRGEQDGQVVVDGEEIAADGT